MKHPFNIEQAKAGAKITTKWGDPVEIINYALNSTYPILGIVTYKDGIQSSIQFGLSGEDSFGGIVAFIDDGIPVKKVFYVNIWRNRFDDEQREIAMFKTEKDALAASINGYSDIIALAKPLEWEE